MKRFAFFLLAITAVIAIPALAPASCGHVVHRNYNYAYHNDYVAPVLVAQFVAVPVPLYSTGYSQPDPALVAELKALREEVKQIRSQPQSQPQAQQPPQVLPQQAPPQEVAFWHAQIIKRDCASCHDKRFKKGGLAMTDGDVLLPLSAQQKMDIIYRLTLPVTHPKHMPPGKDLSPDEAAEITIGIVQR